MSPSQSGKITTQVLGPSQVLLGLGDGRRRRTLFEIRLRADHAEVQRGDIEPLHVMARRSCAVGVGFGQGVAQTPAGRIGVSVQDQHIAIHGMRIAMNQATPP
jgi:hypothetical protein